MNYLYIVTIILLSAMLVSTSANGENAMEQSNFSKTEAQWKETLSDEQYNILREKGTERAFSGKYWDNHETGTYTCAACGLDLFDSATKFESGTGWPSYYQPFAETSVTLKEDNGWFSKRTEVICSRCEGHLGHVFKDGPQPTGLRYCINSVSLNFEKSEK